MGEKERERGERERERSVSRQSFLHFRPREIHERPSHMGVSKARTRNGINIESLVRWESWPCTFRTEEQRKLGLKAPPSKSESVILEGVSSFAEDLF